VLVRVFKGSFIVAVSKENTVLPELQQIPFTLKSTAFITENEAWPAKGIK